MEKICFCEIKSAQSFTRIWFMKIRFRLNTQVTIVQTTVPIKILLWANITLPIDRCRAAAMDLILI